MIYAAPIAEMRFVLEEVAGIGAVALLPGYEMAEPELVGAILGEAAKLAATVLAPLNQPADRVGSVLENGVVRTPSGFRQAYARHVEGGWNGLAADPEFGGQGLPLALAAPVAEMWDAACMSFALCPLLNMAAIELLQAYGSPEQKRLYLGKLVTGEWTGTMNLTEPQAGSDLGALTTRATPAHDPARGDHYRITGQKIFISYGDHDLAGNIVHAVLARTPGAPPGSRGLSLFLVPKFLPDDTGGPGAAQRGAHLAPRTKARHPRLADLLARLRGRDRLAHRRGEPRPRIHVRDDEQCPAQCRAPGCGDRRARLSAGPRLCPHPGAGPPARRSAGGRRRPHCRSSIIPMCGACCYGCARRARRCGRWLITPRRCSTAAAAIPIRPGASATSAAPIC